MTISFKKSDVSLLWSLLLLPGEFVYVYIHIYVCKYVCILELHFKYYIRMYYYHYISRVLFPLLEISTNGRYKISFTMLDVSFV